MCWENSDHSLHIGGRHIWMSFLVVQNFDESDQFTLGRNFVRNFHVTIELNNSMSRLKDLELKFGTNPDKEKSC